MKLAHFFIPHPQTHKKAHLLSIKALVVYVLIFFVLHIGLNTLSHFKPGVLGINSNVNQQELITLTNKERAKKGLNNLKENQKLNQAAYKKGQNMFEENYWAHYSPSGKDPWGFFRAEGYKFAYAGENLARNFYTSDEVVQAWMNSPTHRDNLLNPNYQEIGIAVLEGELKGQKTILIVQEFGTPAEYIADKKSSNDQIATSTKQPTTNGRALAAVNPPEDKAMIDSFMLTKTLGLIVIGFIGALLVLDLIIIKRRAVVRISSRHLPHFAFLGTAAAALWNSGGGSIL